MAIQPTSPVTAQFATTHAATAGKAGASSPHEQTPHIPAPSSTSREAGVAKAHASQQPASPESLRDAVTRAQDALPPAARDIAFSLNEKADRVVIKIIDRESEEVIRQIPSEEFLKIAEALNEQIEDIRAGLLIEQKA